MLLTMIMNGTNIKEQAMFLSHTVLSLSQFIKYNSELTVYEKKGKGTRIRVELENKLPANWQNVLREDGNKRELFNILSERLTGKQFHGLVVMTLGDKIYSSVPFIEDHLSPCGLHTKGGRHSYTSSRCRWCHPRIEENHDQDC